MRRKGYGVVFLAILALLMALVVGLYNQSLPWQGSVTVTLESQKVGNQLNLGGDVKARGVFVGTIKKIEANGETATVPMRLNPGKAKEIPDNVTARIQPKTLFGEKFVDLQIPDDPSPRSLADAGANRVIKIDRSAVALETDKVFED